MNEDNNLNMNPAAIARRERAKVIQTLAALNNSDELTTLAVIYASPTYGLQITLSGNAADVVLGAGQLEMLARKSIFDKPPQETKQGLQS